MWLKLYTHKSIHIHFCVYITIREHIYSKKKNVQERYGVTALWHMYEERVKRNTGNTIVTYKYLKPKKRTKTWIHDAEVTRTIQNHIFARLFSVLDICMWWSCIYMWRSCLISTTKKKRTKTCDDTQVTKTIPQKKHSIQKKRRWNALDL